MTHDDLRGIVETALHEQDRDTLVARLADQIPADLADFIEHADDNRHRIELLMALPLQRRADTFGYLTLHRQQQLAEHLPIEVLAETMTLMPADERADLFKALDEDMRRNLYMRLARKEREDMRRLASYAEGSAGSVMTTDYASIHTGMTVRDALRTLRLTAPDKETIYLAFVVDSAHLLLGTVSLRELILAQPDTRVDELMKRDVIFARTDDTQEEVAKRISRYDLLALPILNHDDTLVGIVTYDDAMDVAEAEATEDMHKGATVGKLDGSFAEVSPWSLYRSRVHWLVVLVFANIFTGAGIALFEDMIAAHVALLFFMPLLVASAGNAGSQSATLMVRGMATGDVTGKDWARLLGREIFVAMALGLTMAAAVMVVGIFRAGVDVAMVVALTMIIVVMVGSLIGMGLPFLLSKLRFDPATASTPLITTIADVSGVLIYFSIASLLLDLV